MTLSLQFQNSPVCPPSFQKVDPISACKQNDPAIKAKWKELRLDWLEEYSQDAAFLMKTRLIYSILGFQNSTLDGLKQNEIKVQSLPGIRKKGLWIKKEGQWTPVSQIRKEIQWNAKVHALVSQNCAVKRWIYLSDQGLTPIHTSYEKSLVSHPHYPQDQDKMHAVTQLSPKEHNELLMHAKRFHQTTPHSAPITCAMQFVTHPASTFKSSYLQNLNAQMNVHVGIRLVMSNGAVYSFGFGADFQEHQLKSKTSQCLATINGQPKIIDYMEFQKYAGQRLVTTVPLNETQAETILNHLNFYRKNGVRFNILKQNCVRFSSHLLHLAGISLNTRVSLLTTAWRCLPNVENLPMVGMPMACIKRVGQKVYHSVAAKIPKIVKKVFVSLAALIFYIPHQIAIFVLNFGLSAVGGKMGSSNSSLDLEKTEGIGQLENFDTLVPHLLDSQSLYVYHSSVFMHWQLNQKTTEAYRYSGQPRMNILPPKAPEEKAFSNQKKVQLKATYQASQEVTI